MKIANVDEGLKIKQLKVSLTVSIEGNSNLADAIKVSLL